MRKKTIKKIRGNKKKTFTSNNIFCSILSYEKIGRGRKKTSNFRYLLNRNVFLSIKRLESLVKTWICRPLLIEGLRFWGDDGEHLLFFNLYLFITF